VTTIAYEAGRRAWETVPRARLWLENVRPVKLLVPAVALQWLSTLGLVLAVRHNGFLFYQGGDQLWIYGSGWLLGHGTLPYPLVGPLLPALLAPLSAIAGPDLVPALPAIVLANVLVLAPVALLCIYGIAQRIGGRVFAYWATLLWLVVPLIGIKYTDLGYHQRYTEVTLPQSFGLTAMADYPSMVAVLVSVYFAFRTIERRDAVDALACGLAAGVAIAVKPSNSIFLAGLILAFAYRRRLLQAGYVALGLLPALVTLALWKYRGLGYMPILHAEGAVRLTLGQHSQAVASINPLHKYVNLNWHQLHLNLLEIKEHFWSMRVIEWLVLAGLIGLGRRSVTALLLVGGWFVAFVVVKGTFSYADINTASLFRIMMPSFPAFVLLLASLVYLLPGKRRREEPPVQPKLPRRVRLGAVVAAGVVFALYPFALVALASPLHGPTPRAYEVDVLLRPVDPSLKLAATVSGGHVLLRWNPAEPWAAKVFYRIWRSGAANGGAVCAPVTGGTDRCSLTVDDLGAHPSGAWIDRPGSGTWTYRLGLAANWLNSPDYGDVFTVGPPVTVRVP
jgi:hypothetical protein